MNNISPNTLLAANENYNPRNSSVRTLIQFLSTTEGPTSYYPTPIGLNDVGYGASDETFFFDGVETNLLSSNYQEDMFIVVRNLTGIAPFNQTYDIRYANSAYELIDIANSYLFEGQSVYTNTSTAINGMLNSNILIMPYNLPNFSTNLQPTSDYGIAGNLGIVCGFISGFTSCISKYMNLPTFIRCFTSGFNTSNNVGNHMSNNANPIVLSYEDNYGIEMLSGENLVLNNTADIPFGNQAFSFSCWFSVDNASTTQILASWGYIKVQISSNGIQVLINGSPIISVIDVLTSGSYYNVVITYDPTITTITSQIFSTIGSVSFVSTTASLNNPTQNFYLSDASNVNSFLGYIKSCMLYSFVLTETQINSDYNNMLPLVVATPSIPTTTTTTTTTIAPTTSTTTTTTTICAPFINTIIISNGSYTPANGTYSRGTPLEGFSLVGGNGAIFFGGDAWYIFNAASGNAARNTSELGTGTWEPWPFGYSTGITAEYFYFTCPTTTTTTSSTTTSTTLPNFTSTTTTTTTEVPTTTTSSTTTTTTSNVITNGLVLNLDASIPASYSGTGSTWFDLSGLNNDATLVNSPTYSSSFGGYITTNGTSSFATIANNSTLDDNTVTVSLWLQYTSVTADGGSGYGSIISLGSSSGTYNGWNLYIYLNTLYAQIKTNPSPSETNITGTTLSTGTWYNITLVAVSGGTSYLYLNNILLNSAATIGFTVTNAQPLRIARAVDAFWSYFGGNLGQITIYNRALTTLELTDNYNNTKTRFQQITTSTTTTSTTTLAPTTTTTSTTTTTTTLGVVSNGLIVSLDASNPSSYSGSGTTWTDLTGNGYNATRQGSVPFTSAGQQSFFSFSGSSSNYFLGNSNLYGFNSNQISGTVGITVSMIIRPSNISTRSTLWSTYASDKGSVFEIGTLGGLWTNTLRQYLSDNGPIRSSDNRGFPNQISNGTTYLLTVTWNQSTYTSTMYVNGSAIASSQVGFNKNNMTSAWANSANYNLGGDPTQTGTYGNLYTAYIYNRPLTAEEVATNYNALQSRFGL